MADNAPAKTPSITDLATLIVGLNAKIESLEQKLAAKVAAAPAEVQGTELAKKPWEEVIWVEPTMDCVYPDVDDTYGRYRKAAKGEMPADLFRIAHREHLHKYMRDVTAQVLKGEKVVAVAEKQIPQTAGRGRRETARPF